MILKNQSKYFLHGIFEKKKKSIDGNDKIYYFEPLEMNLVCKKVNTISEKLYLQRKISTALEIRRKAEKNTRYLEIKTSYIHN